MEIARTQTDRPFIAAYFIVMILMMLIFCAGISVEGKTRNMILAEGGLVETLSATGYFLCALFIIYKGGLKYLKEYHHLFLIVFLFGLRELDFDKRFTTMGILKSRFLTSPEVPIVEKIVGAVVIALLVYIAVRTCRCHLRRFIKNFRRLSAVTIGISLVTAFLLIAKGLDGLDRKFKSLGVQISDHLSENTSALEEVLELGVPVILFFTFAAYFQSAAPSDTHSSQPAG